MHTECISAEGLIREADKRIKKLDIYDYERAISIQIFGEKIESMREAANPCWQMSFKWVQLATKQPCKLSIGLKAAMLGGVKIPHSSAYDTG